MRPANPLVRAIIAAGGFAALPAQAADVALARLQCGGQPEPVSVASFSDTYALEDVELQLVYSCYLVRHGDQYLLWDTGNAMNGSPAARRLKAACDPPPGRPARRAPPPPSATRRRPARRVRTAPPGPG